MRNHEPNNEYSEANKTIELFGLTFHRSGNCYFAPNISLVINIEKYYISFYEAGLYTLRLIEEIESYLGFSTLRHVSTNVVFNSTIEPPHLITNKKEYFFKALEAEIILSSIPILEQLQQLKENQQCLIL